MITPSPEWGLVSVGVVVLLAVLGVPIAAAMGIVGLAFAWLFKGALAIDLTGITAWSYSYSYMLSMIPLFVLMGNLIEQSGLGRDAFDCFYKWVSKVKGGLAITSTVTCALFGCITGSTAATIVTIGGISAPEMKRRGYSKELSLGSIAVAGILATLIPPSNMAILYGVVTEVSIGKLFMAGLIPGVILTILFSVTIYIWVSLRPSIAPVATESFSLKERVVSLKGLLPILIIFIAIVGGIYTGFFSPTEAAGAGAVYAIALTLLMRRLTWQRFKAAVVGAVRVTTFIMFLIMGAMIFGQAIALSRLSQYIAEMILGAGASPLLLIFAIIVVFLVLGCFMTPFEMLVLFVPLFYPAVIGLGYDPIWFGTLVIVLLEIGLITPPVANHLYIAQSLDPEATTMNVVRGVVPFYGAAIILLVLLVFFPQIALWLPGTM